MAANWKEDWRQDLAKLLIGFLIGGLCLVGVALLTASGRSFLITLKPAHDVEDLMDYGGAKEGMHVTGQLPYIYDCFANLSDLDGDKASAYYYALPTVDGVLIVSVPKAQHNAMETLWEQTWEYVESGNPPTSPVPIEGYVTKAMGRLPYLLTEYMTEALEYSQEEIDAMGEPLVIQYATESLQRARINAPVGVILLTSGILLFLLYIFVIKRRLFG